MFSRFRMNPIVEIQGSDWDWLRLTVRSGRLARMWWRAERKNTDYTLLALTGIQFRTIDSSYYWIQLPAWGTKKVNSRWELNGNSTSV